jgi:hypothetical protein
MKKLFFAFVATSVLVLASCSTTGTEAEVPTVDTTVVTVDTTSAVVDTCATVDTTVTK